MPPEPSFDLRPKFGAAAVIPIVNTSHARVVWTVTQEAGIGQTFYNSRNVSVSLIQLHFVHQCARIQFGRSGTAGADRRKRRNQGGFATSAAQQKRPFLLEFETMNAFVGKYTNEQ